MPPGAKVTYGNFICDIRQHKNEKHRVRLTVGGDQLDYEHDARSPAVSLLDTKLMINSVISDAHRGAIYCTADIQNFYLNNPMKTYRYMHIPLHIFSDVIITKYNLNSIAVEGYVYIEIQKGMYGIKEADIIAFQALVTHLAPYGYYPVKHTPGLWRHKTSSLIFTLAVDNFGIKCFDKSHANHLFHAI